LATADKDGEYLPIAPRRIGAVTRKAINMAARATIAGDAPG
jgi:hypothetical protein